MNSLLYHQRSTYLILP